VPGVRGRLLLGRGQGCPAGVGNQVIPFKPAAIAMNVYLLDPDETERQQADDAGPGFPFVLLPCSLLAGLLGCLASVCFNAATRRAEPGG